MIAAALLSLCISATPADEVAIALALAKAQRDRLPAAALTTPDAAPAPVRVQTAVVGPWSIPAYNRHAGAHTHHCNACGFEWTHSDSNQGKLNPHVCPNCGALPPGAKRVPTVQRNCPIGVH